MAKKNDQLAKRDDDHLDSPEPDGIGQYLVEYADPNDAFRGLEGEMYPEVWSFKRPGQTLVCTPIGRSAPVIVNDEWDGEVPRDTWEIALAPTVRIRLMTSAQLDQMIPGMLGKLITLCYVEQVEVKGGARRVKVFRAAIHKDQSNAVPLTPEEAQRAADLVVELASERRDKIAAAKARQVEREAERRSRSAKPR